MIPRCPKCGCQAREIILTKARVRCVLNDDGEPGKVLSASRDAGTDALYQCGGAPVCKPFTLEQAFKG